MTGQKKGLCLLAMLIGWAGLAQANPEDEAAIRAQTMAWAKSYNSGDAKGVVA